MGLDLAVDLIEGVGGNGDLGKISGDDGGRGLGWSDVRGQRQQVDRFHGCGDAGQATAGGVEQAHALVVGDHVERVCVRLPGDLVDHRGPRPGRSTRECLLDEREIFAPEGHRRSPGLQAQVLLLQRDQGASGGREFRRAEAGDRVRELAVVRRERLVDREHRVRTADHRARTPLSRHRIP